MKKLVAILLILVLCVSACTYAAETPVCGRTDTENFRGGRITENQGEDSTGRRAGDTVTFGTWGGEPIEWQIMEDKGDGTYVLLSVKILDAKPYNTKNEKLTWEACSLRAWLNGTFYKTAFSKSEKGKIVRSTVETPDNYKCDTKGGKTTNDYVYILSLEEVGRYFNTDAYGWGKEEALICMPTQTALKNGAFTVTQNKVNEKQPKYSYPLKVGACSWWLRSPGLTQNMAAYISHSGDVYHGGDSVNSEKICVRPVICVRF